MKNLFRVIIVISFTSCAIIKDYKHTEVTFTKKEMECIIESITHIEAYNSDMGSGDTFIYPILQGIPFSDAELYTLQRSANLLFSELAILDKFYLFSQLTNGILICDSALHTSGGSIESFYLENKELDVLTSPTYNGRFLLTTIFPTTSDSVRTWNSFSYQLCHTDTLQKRIISIPSIQASGYFSCFKICRPWLDNKMITLNQEHFNKKIAIIDGIIIAKNLKIECMNDSYRIKLFRHKKNYKIISNPTSICIYSPNTIIGYYCRVL